MSKITSSSESQRFINSLAMLLVVLGVFIWVLVLDSEPRISPPDEQVFDALRASKRRLIAATLELPSHEPPAEVVNVAAHLPNQPKPTKASTSVLVPPVMGGIDAISPQVQQAIEAIDNGRVNEAMSLLEGVLKQDPDNEQALVELAMIHLLDLRQPDRAIDYLQRVMEVNPQNRIVMSELVSLYEEQGRVDEGLSFMTNIQSSHPDSAGDLAYGIGQMLAMQGRDSEAIPHLEKAARQGEDPVRAYRDLAEAYARNGDLEKALSSYDKTIEWQEKEIQDKGAKGLPVKFDEERLGYTKLDKARALIRVGDYDKAQSLLDEVEVTMPDLDQVAILRKDLDRRRSG